MAEQTLTAVETLKMYETAALSYVYVEHGGNYQKSKFHGKMKYGRYVRVSCGCSGQIHEDIIELEHVQMWSPTKEILDLYVGLCRYGVVHYAIYSGGGATVSPPPADKSS